MKNNYSNLKQHEDKIGVKIDYALKNENTCRRLVNNVISKINGYDDMEEYHDQSTVNNIIKNIKIPYLFIHSNKDPVCISECIPYLKIEDNPNCMLILTKTGGHVCWHEGWRADNWVHKPSLEFLNY